MIPSTILNTTKIIFVLALVIFILPTSSTEKVLYEGHQVWSVTPRNNDDVKFIEQLEDANDISIWNLLPTRADFLINSENRAKVQTLLQQNQLNHTVMIMDVYRRIQSSIAVPANLSQDALRLGKHMNWKSFPTLKNIEDYLDYLSEDYSSIVKVTRVGTSANNRKIKMISVSNGNPANKQIVITGGQHAREWVSITSALYIIDKIVTQFNNQPDFIKKLDWHVIPVANPDGYVYTMTNDRLWRKNRRKLQSCYGVDLNRNFGTDWRGRSNASECRDTYPGPSPFSEPETKAIRNAYTIIKRKKIPSAYLDIHSYGQLVVYPWSSTKTTSAPDEKTLKSTAAKIVKAISSGTGHSYTASTAPQILYSVRGAAIDWFYAHGARSSYAIETRDQGEYGFLLPPNEIEETGKDLFIAVKKIAENLNTKRKTSG